MQAVSVEVNMYGEVGRPWHNAYNRAMLALVAKGRVMFDNHPALYLEVVNGVLTHGLLPPSGRKPGNSLCGQLPRHGSTSEGHISNTSFRSSWAGSADGHSPYRFARPVPGH